MIQTFDLSKSFGSRKLLENITFSVAKGEIIGLVGRNGCGKSTLFKMILGQESPDGGEITIPKGYQLGHLDQHISFSNPSVLMECCSVLPEEEQYDFYRAEKLLSGLGFSEDDMHRSPEEFSGGYQLRINLVKSLLKKPDLLLLDEPTNYLDILSLIWLRKFLKTFPGEVILITHDRSFMDSVITHTMGISRAKLKKVKGTTDHYYEKMIMEDEIYEKTRANQDKKVKHLQSFVDRFGAKASKATQAQSKMKQIQKISIGQSLSKEAILGFRFNYSEIASKNLLQVDGLGFSYDGVVENQLFKKLKFQLSSTDRIAVIGKNGKGKSTLLNVLADQLKPTQGSYKFHPSVKLGYYQQTHKKNLNRSNTVADEISNSNVDLGLAEVRSICGAVMFPGDDALKKIAVLSGGEQGRVLLGKILAHPSNVLLLDEPSNHLDMESIEVMTSEIQKFKGGVMFVTHNENMLRVLANKLIIFNRDSAELFNGTYDEFLEKIGWEEDLKPKKNQEASESQLSYKERKSLNKKQKQLEKKISDIEAEIEKLEAVLTQKNKDVEIHLSVENSQNSALQDTYKEIGEVQTQIEQLFSQLETQHSDLEKLLGGQ